MGLPLAPLLANWFVSKIERGILSDKKHDRYKPVFYRRYVDDIFAIFNNPADRDSFLDALNSAHPNLSFTMETTSDALPFLDVEVSIKDGYYNTRVYRKPTNTGVVLNFESMAPLKWKKALVMGMLNRAYKLTSSLTYFQAEVENIKSSLRKNRYPDRFVNQICDHFIALHKIDQSSFPKTDIIVDGKPKDEKLNFLTIPFVGRPSQKLQHVISTEMKKMNISILASYTTTKVRSYFNLKDRCPKLFTSNVVYKYTCLRDEDTAYVGETRRQLFRRIEDHRGKDQNSAVFNHLQNCLICQSTDNICHQFTVLERCTPQNLLSYEALFIAKLRPVLNTQLGPTKGTAVTLRLYN